MRALVLGATGGIGAAVAEAIDGEVIALSRQEGLDWSTPERAEHILSDLNGPFDLIICATGQLAPDGLRPEKSLRALSADQLAQQFMVNAIGPALLLRHLPRLLPKERPSHVALLSARVGSIGDNALGGWYSYRASKAALNQLVKTAAVELARSHSQACLIAYHPGTVETSFTQDYAADKLTPSEAAGHLLRVVTQNQPAQTGCFLDWKGEEVPW